MSNNANLNHRLEFLARHPCLALFVTWILLACAIDFMAPHVAGLFLGSRGAMPAEIWVPLYFFAIPILLLIATAICLLAIGAARVAKLGASYGPLVVGLVAEAAVLPFTNPYGLFTWIAVTCSPCI